jgi:glycosyltransferase involved in cell wall biosynthesis
LKLLFIHEVNYETKVIFELQEFPELLALRGHEVHFLQFPENTGIKNLSLKSKSKMITGRAYSEARIKLITPPTLGGNFIDRVLSTIYSIPSIYNLIKTEKYDAIILLSVPTTGWQTALLAKTLKTPVLFRALDVSHLLRSGISKKLVLWAEKVVYKNVSAISANNSALAEYCSAHNGQNKPITVNVPPLDLSLFYKTKNSHEVRQGFNISDDDFVIMFMGTLYEFSGLNKVVSDFAKLKPELTKLVIVGGGVGETALRQQVEDLKLNSQVIFTGVIPYEDVPAVLGIADVAINSFEPSLVTNVAFPQKVLQYLAAGLVTVSTKLKGLYGSLGLDSGVFWVDETSDILMEAMQLKNTSAVELAAKKEQGRNFVAQKFGKENAVTDFENAIKAVTTK